MWLSVVFFVLVRNLLSFLDRLITFLPNFGASLVAQVIKSLPAMWETEVWSLGWEDLLQKEMATHSSILAWKIPWTKEPRGLQSMGTQRIIHNWATNTHSKFWKFSGVVSSNIFFWTIPSLSQTLNGHFKISHRSLRITETLYISFIFFSSDFFFLHLSSSDWIILLIFLQFHCPFLLKSPICC